MNTRNAYITYDAKRLLELPGDRVYTPINSARYALALAL